MTLILLKNQVMNQIKNQINLKMMEQKVIQTKNLIITLKNKWNKIKKIEFFINENISDIWYNSNIMIGIKINKTLRNFIIGVLAIVLVFVLSSLIPEKGFSEKYEGYACQA